MASPAFRKSALEYVERAEFLKRDLPRLLELAKTTKSPSRILLEKAEFAVLKAQLLDEAGHCSLAIDWYSEAIQVCIQAGENCAEGDLRLKLRKIANSALERVEHLKKVEEQKRVEALTENLPDVPVDELSRLNLAADPPSEYSTPSPSPITPRKAAAVGLTQEELAVLATTSYINGRKYVPFLSVDLKEKFNYSIPFTDKDGKLTLTEKQKKRIKAWLRPHEIFEEPKLIGTIDSGTIKQTVISDCSFVASLSITARYEKRFGKQVITSIIYPQNKAGQPVYNPSGKYMVKFHINGVWRKVIIDDYLPTDENMCLLCSHSQSKGELWVSLLEKAYLKVMGGYDFPGSNSNIDLHALTGWIPDRISIKDRDPSFDGNKGKRLLMVKNPWTHLRWKGRFSENDLINWTPSLCKALDYDPNQAKTKDDGVFWIDFESVCHFFDVFYFNLTSIKSPYKVKKVESGKWEGRTAGGCGNGASRETWKNNPLYEISLEESSDENLILIDLKGPRQYSVGFDLQQVSSARNKPFEKNRTDVFRPGYTVLAVEKVPAGVYSIRPMTFQAGQEGPFILKVEASCGFSMKRVQ
ncbi:Calpain catalytic domain-containing protein [Trichostrongylus colubriformis]|uniref:Calpain catalytic domain-containing protein n=1 Tax=Trichostrongylus colubriformis TaxID=6319 RepID=A0AAN8FT14_TRICO